MNCIVAGGTGLVGQFLLRELAKEEKVDSITALTRSSVFYKNDKIIPLRTSFEKLDLVEFPQADAGFCCLGTTLKKAGSKAAFTRVDHDYVVTFAKRCKAAGVSVFMYVSALGADPDSKIFYNQVKGKTEKDLEVLNFDRLVILRPSLLLGPRKENRPVEKAAQLAGRFLKPLMFGPLAAVQPVEAEKVARRMRSEVLEIPYTKVQIIANNMI